MRAPIMMSADHDESDGSVRQAVELSSIPPTAAAWHLVCTVSLGAARGAAVACQRISKRGAGSHDTNSEDRRLFGSGAPGRRRRVRTEHSEGARRLGQR